MAGLEGPTNPLKKTLCCFVFLAGLGEVCGRCLGGSGDVLVNLAGGFGEVLGMFWRTNQ